MFLDADEFLVINSGENLDSILERYSSEDDIYVNWRIFGDSGRTIVEDCDYSCIRRFIMCGKGLHRLGKNILNFKKNGERFRFYNPHIVLLDGKPFPCSDSNLVKREYIWEHTPTEN